mmetsp:Transcript_75718/g.152133  ORF Transcript_75718/g.152133 Transcript_75718/m.152133 type:complete len:380 (+) Transcript_75718:54-1193(+)
MLRWTKFCAPRLSDARCVALSERLLLLGGFGETESTGLRLHEAPLHAPQSNAEMLSPTSTNLEWRSLVNGPLADRGGHGVAALTTGDSSETVVVHGGYGAVEGNLGDLWLLESGGTWRPCTPKGVAPSARAAHSLSPLYQPANHTGGECLVYGGFGELALDDVHIFQLGLAANDEGVWLQPRVLGESPGARCAHSAVATRCGGVVVFGGHSAYGPDAALSLLEVSTPLAEKESARLGERAVIWTTLHAAPPQDDDLGAGHALERSGHSAVLLSNDRMMVIGGTRSDGSDHSDALGDVLCLDVSEEGLERARHPGGGARWERQPLARGPGGESSEDELARYNHACAVLGAAVPGAAERVLVFGGNNANHEPLGSGISILV